RDFVFVDDISRACLLALESYAQADPVNIGSGVGTTINELVKTVLKTTEHDVPIEFDTSRPTTNRYRVLDTEHAQKTLDFQTQISVEEGILRTVNWIQGKEEAFI
ncbi:MAG: GDP-L-fucose synthase, partial [Candidatus Lindowbacteria bacterium]|nr:GDP-L-fucose synthase [Candidatus Lindowbacteria bacterium]